MTPNSMIFMLCHHVGIGSPLSTASQDACAKEAVRGGYLYAGYTPGQKAQFTDKGRAYIDGLEAVPEPTAVWSCKQ